MEDKYYNFDILCHSYFRGGVIDTDVEMYAKNKKQLEKLVDDYVKEEYGEEFYKNATEYGPLEIKINYSH